MSSSMKLKLKCPECQEPLKVDELEHRHCWCDNPKCKLFIKREPPYDLMFSYVGESFSGLIKETET